MFNLHPKIGFGEIGFGKIGFGETGFGKRGFGEIGFGKIEGHHFMKPVIDGTGQCAWLWTEVCEIQGVMVHHECAEYES
jgi:hypothetical protein